MSKISNIYDALIARLVTVYPNHTRLPNPYKPEENFQRFLEAGYGLRVGSGVNDEMFTGCELGIKRQFNLILTRKWISLESDAATKASVEKTLFEDQFLMIQNLESDISLSGQNFNAKYISDNGLEFVLVDNDKFLMIDTILEISYVESLT